MICPSSLSLFLLSVSALLAGAIPQWDGFVSSNAFDNLVSAGAQPIVAVGQVAANWAEQRIHLSVRSPGTPGNLTVQKHYKIGPPAFYIKQRQLWHYVNATTSFPVNLVNSTAYADMPLQLTIGTKQEGFKEGFWRWQGTMLYYDHGRFGNQGLYYTCPTPTGTGIFTSIDPAAKTPETCEYLTLHSFTRDTQGRRQDQAT